MIQGTERPPESGKPKEPAEAGSHYEHLLLGGGVTAGYALQEMIGQGVEGGAVALVSDDDRPPYDRPPLSKSVLQGEMDPEEALLSGRDFYDDHGVDLHLQTRIIGADFEERTLHSRQGSTFGFDKLLIAVGGMPRRLQVPGAELGRVHLLRTAHDAEEIVRSAGEAERAVVVGGGFIGTEVAASLRERGLEVTLVYREDRLLKDRPLTEEMSAFFEGRCREEGVELLAGESVCALEGTDKVDRAVLQSGGELEADLAVIGIGVEPAVGIFEDNGLTLENGIVVDDHLRTGVEGVWAAGDCARYHSRRYDRLLRVEHWDTAKAQGEHVARAMLGAEEPYEHLPYFFSDVFDLSWEYWGDHARADEVVHRGEIAGGSFATFWLNEGAVDAAFATGRPDEERDAIPKLVREAAEIDPDILRDPSADL